MSGIALPCDAGELLAIEPATPAERIACGPWPSACTPALAHPGLPFAANVARGRGAHLCLDTSLGSEPLRHIGGYFNAPRATVAVALDSSWSELMHELTHAAFHDRVRLGADGLSDPLRTHWQVFRDRGLSDEAAEEMVCRAHELQALRAPGERRVRRALTALLVLDSALIEAIKDIEAVGLASERQTRELRRMHRVRFFIGGRARAVYLMAVLVVGVVLLSKALRKAGLIPPPPGTSRAVRGGREDEREQSSFEV